MYFSNGNVPILEWIFYLSLPLSIPLLSLCNCLELEHIPKIQNYLSDEYGNINVQKVLLFRLSLCILMFAPVFLIEDEYFLILLGGGIFSPFLGMIIPVC